jgi:hypothetical protein
MSKWLQLLKNLSSHEKINAFLTTLILLATFVNASATVIYVIYVRRSGKTASQQTGQLIAAANVQASAATRNAESAASMAASASQQAEYAKSIADQTLAQATATNKLAGQAARSADAVKTGTEIARNQLELSERPWIRISFTVGAQGFSFQNGSAGLPLQAHIQNTGHSVATGVIVPVKMFLAYDENGIFIEPLKRQKDLCDPVAEMPTGDRQLGDMALTIFPGDTDVSMSYGVGVGKDEIDSAKTLIPQGSESPKVGGGKRILPIVVGCVDYQYATSTHHHQTRFIYQVQRVDRSLPPGVYPVISIEVPKTVAPDDVVLQKYAFGGFLAN